MTESLQCQHDNYCSLNKNICQTTDFPKICRMKKSDIEQMPLLKSVKERVQRDEKRKNES